MLENILLASRTASKNTCDNVKRITSDKKESKL